MTTGTVLTKGTRLYVAVAASEIHKVACPTGVSGLGGSKTQIPTTCMDSEEAEFVGGMGEPGQVTIPINFIPRSASHQALIELDRTGEVVSWMVVEPGQAPPTTTDSDGRLVSPGATTVEFLAYVSDFTFDITTNEIWRGSLVLQRSGAKVWTLPTADLA